MQRAPLPWRCRRRQKSASECTGEASVRCKSMRTAFLTRPAHRALMKIQACARSQRNATMKMDANINIVVSIKIAFEARTPRAFGDRRRKRKAMEHFDLQRTDASPVHSLADFCRLR